MALFLLRSLPVSSILMTRILALTVLGLCLVFSGCGRPSYDKARYEKMEAVMLRSTNMLAGIPLAEASRLLALEGARWNEGYSNVPLGQERIYHFDGFCLRLDLEVLPPGIMPGSKKPFHYVEQQLRTNGVWWVAKSWPRLEIDRLEDAATRMSNYWDNAQASFRRRGAEQKIIQAIMRRPPR